jgi:hypothetical protein
MMNAYDKILADLKKSYEAASRALTKQYESARKAVVAAQAKDIQRAANERDVKVRRHERTRDLEKLRSLLRAARKARSAAK